MRSATEGEPGTLWRTHSSASMPKARRRRGVPQRLLLLVGGRLDGCACTKFRLPFFGGVRASRCHRQLEVGEGPHL